MLSLGLKTTHCTLALIEKILCDAWLEFYQESRIEKSPRKEFIRIKRRTRNPANYHLYHALMEALIADEDAMDKEVKDRVKNHKRKHDSDDDEDDDDDEGPSAGSNQGKSTKRRRHDLRGSDPKSEHSEQSSDDIPMQDEGHVSDLEDTDNAHIPKRIKLKRKTYDIGSFHHMAFTDEHEEEALQSDLEGDKRAPIIALSITKLKDPRIPRLERVLEELVPSCADERNSTSTNILSPLIVKQSDSQDANSQCDSVKIYYYSIFKRNAQPSAKDRQDSLHTQSTCGIIEYLVIRKNSYGSLQLGIESYQTKDHLKMEMEMEIPSVKASANSDIIFFFTSAQDGNKLLDDERLSLADDLKKAHDQNQNKSK
ncbi:hypothetical protein Tco_0939211 [Tanacetum coccineum]|uniref:Uncharacterized protein n=1 Tax=Tanacetum coccineum TaxID=301880 RepID=A0ABQ5DM43_9ASTR